MTILAPPWPGPPLFVAYIRERPPFLDMRQGYFVKDVSLRATEDKHSLCGSTGKLNSQFLLISLNNFVF